MLRSTIVLSMAQIILGLTSEHGTLLTMPCIALEHVMTCRVHRAVILGLITDKQPPNSTFLLTTFIASVNASTMVDQLDTKKRSELQEGQTPSAPDAV